MRYERTRPSRLSRCQSVYLPLQRVYVASFEQAAVSHHYGPSEAYASPFLLERVRAALEGFVDQRLTLKAFEASLEDVEGQVWQSLFDRTPPTTGAYADLCCLLAFHGMDYVENVCRLCQTFGFSGLHSDAPESRLLSTPDGARGYYLSEYLLLLYSKHRDFSLLGILLELRPATSEARDAQMDAIATLWDEHALPLLLSASQCRMRLRQLVRALARVCLAVREAQVWRAYYRDLQRAVYLREASLMRTARTIMAWLRRLEKRAW